MRTPLIALLSGVLASLLFAGTANAGPTEQVRPVPKGKTALVANPIYKSGKLEPDPCPEQPAYDNDLESAEAYLNAVLDCLNEGWGYQFSKTELPFSKPRFSTTSRLGVPTGCGKFPRGAQAVYCPANKKITFYLSKEILSQASELFLFQVLAHEYGHHVQQLSGIWRAMSSVKYKSNKEALAAIRKVELQAECLSGVFIGSVWRSLGRRESDFRYVMNAAYSTASHGKAANIAYWLTRGFRQEAPGACNTFSAPKSRVS
ncbi:neutral zinc metallopeptidase [Streptosporangium amethystogenes subsp. fukuiense]|uniref:Neutral zinc metallopeptidase n=1 Tax=Streptosporangium amethystogenes subsp. fukuiense TaxID=698418 RepID=A0ABW2SRY1_9ACTN